MCDLCRALGNELDTLWHSDANVVYDGLADGSPSIAYAAPDWQSLTGDPKVDSLLSGAKWSGTVTYSFTDSASDYVAGYGAGEPLSGFSSLTGAERQLIDKIVAQIEGFTTLDIQRNDEAGISDSDADIRLARSDRPSTAYTYLPGVSSDDRGGDVWIGNAYAGYNNPVQGSYSYVTHLHEFGHALGLKHPHDTSDGGTALSAANDGLEYSVMSYRSYPGGSTTAGYTNETYGFPQSYMRNDILALQEMYGADFGLNSGDSVYRWNAATGEMSIATDGGQGVGQGAPGANRVFLTIWDGGGNDTYDMSNYSTGVSINLTPGLWSVTSVAQKANLGNGHYAQGNVYNAFQFDGDARSLIENAIGGTGDDTIIGNAADNSLDGGKGNDTLTGGSGNDRFVIHVSDGQDIVTDFTAGGSQDQIYLDNFVYFRTFGQVMEAATQVGFNTVFNCGPNKLTLLNVTMGNLTEDDFAFSNPVPVSTTAPTDITVSGALTENIKGCQAGAVLVTDPDGDTDFTFDLSDSRFEILRDYYTGVYSLKLKDGIQLDNEIEPTVGIDITATDLGGFSFQKHVTIDVLDGRGVVIGGNTGNDLVDATHTVAGYSLPTDDNDQIIGDAGNDTLYGLGGNDEIYGGVGNDFLYGGTGNDTLIGGAGADYIDGGAGDDIFRAASDEALNDIILGGSGNDRFEVAGALPLILAGFGPANSIEIWSGGNVLGTTAANILDFSGIISSPLMFVDASAGNDVIKAPSSAPGNLKGGAGNDSIYGGTGSDLLYGQGGVDYLDGGNGNDRLFIVGSEALSDTMFGGDGVDAVVVDGTLNATLAGFGPANSIEEWFGNGKALLGTSAVNIFDFSGLTYADLPYVDAGAGNDTLVGSVLGLDLRGGTGNDSISGGSGNESLYGGAGVDTIDGGAGNDLIYITGTEASTDTIQGGDGIDSIVVTGTTAATLAGFGPANSIEVWSGNNTALLGTSVDNVFDLTGLTSRSGLLYVDGAGGNDTLIGSASSDDLRGGVGNDSISGGDGDDALYGGAGVDSIDGGLGNDTIYIAAAEASIDNMQGGDGSDAIRTLGTGRVTLSGFSAANSIEAWLGNNAGVLGTGADNILDFSGLTSKTSMGYIDGGSGNDTLTGTAFADDLRGGGGNDILKGGAGNDLLNGGKGADTLVFDGDFGNDTIVGFTAGAALGHDVIQFSTAQFVDFADVMAHATQVGTSVVIALDGSNSVTLQSMTLVKLVDADFQFV